MTGSLYMSKKTVYLYAFGVLGGLVGLLVGMALEIGVIGLYLRDTALLFLPWEAYLAVRTIVQAALIALGAWGGYTRGTYWWRAIYVEKRLGNK